MNGSSLVLTEQPAEAVAGLNGVVGPGKALVRRDVEIFEDAVSLALGDARPEGTRTGMQVHPHHVADDAKALGGLAPQGLDAAQGLLLSADISGEDGSPVGSCCCRGAALYSPPLRMAGSTSEATQLVKASASGLLERKASLYTAGSEMNTKSRVGKPSMQNFCMERFHCSGRTSKRLIRHAKPRARQTSTAANQISLFSVTVRIWRELKAKTWDMETPL